MCSTVAAATSLLCFVITAAALATVEEQRSNHELYRSIYYDQGLVHRQNIPEQSININDIKELPSEVLHGSEQNDGNREAQGHVKVPQSFYNSAVINKGEPGQNIKDNSEQVIILGTSEHSHDDIQRNASHHTSENVKSKNHLIQTGTASRNIIQNLEEVAIGIVNTTEASEYQYSAIWKPTEENLEIENGQVLSEYPDSGERRNCGLALNDSTTKCEVLLGTNVTNETRNESTYTMKITNIKTNQTNNVFIKSSSNHDPKLSPPSISGGWFNGPKTSAIHYPKDELLDNGEGHQKTAVIEDKHMHPKIYNHDDTQDMTTIPSINYEAQDEENVSEIIHNLNNSNQELSEFLSSKLRLEQEPPPPPEYEKSPSAREVRTVVAINILVASALELAWSLLSASIAWKGMKNCYPHENISNTCERNIEGLERSLPPPPPPSNDAYTSDKGHHKIDGITRKPDIIYNHQHRHPGNSVHFSAVQNKNGVNRFHVINTESERINIEPYLPMEESTMEYQERVHRFLASNNIANNTCDSAS